MKGKTSRIVLLVLLLMLVLGAVFLFIGIYAWKVGPYVWEFHNKETYNAIYGTSLGAGFFLVAFAFSIAFLMFYPEQKTLLIISIAGSLIIIGLAILVTATSSLEQIDIDVRESVLHFFIGGFLTYIGAFMCSVAIVDYFWKNGYKQYVKWLKT